MDSTDDSGNTSLRQAGLLQPATPLSEETVAAIVRMLENGNTPTVAFRVSGVHAAHQRLLQRTYERLLANAGYDPDRIADDDMPLFRMFSSFEQARAKAQSRVSGLIVRASQDD